MGVVKYPTLFTAALLITLLVFWVYSRTHERDIKQYTLGGDLIALPQPRYESGVSVEGALFGRRSVRDFRGQPLTLSELSQLLWSAQGVTSEWGGRTAPSAGATYPVEVFVAVGDVRVFPPASTIIFH